ncbi:hypothetical protein R6Q59_018979 [Mikania micrantha]
MNEEPIRSLCDFVSAIGRVFERFWFLLSQIEITKMWRECMTFCKAPLTFTNKRMGMSSGSRKENIPSGAAPSFAGVSGASLKAPYRDKLNPFGDSAKCLNVLKMEMPTSPLGNEDLPKDGNIKHFLKMLIVLKQLILTPDATLCSSLVVA